MMMLENPDELWRLAKVAEDAAAKAAAYIKGRRPALVEHKDGGDGAASQVVTEVDRGSEAIILETLRPVLGDFGLLTEEREDDGSRLEAPAFWCIDPLDGTLAYIRGKRGPAVSIALVRQDGVPLIGVMQDVFSGQRAQAVLDGGLMVDGDEWWPWTRSGVMQVFGDWSFDDNPENRRIAEQLGSVAINVGQAAVLNAWCALTFPPAVYFKLPRAGRGGGCLWDYAATACFFREAGGVATTFAGDPLPLNRPDTPFLADCGVMFASDRVLADKVRAVASGG